MSIGAAQRRGRGAFAVLSLLSLVALMLAISLAVFGFGLEYLFTSVFVVNLP